MKFLALVRLGRPQFLVGGFLLYGLGAAIAAHHGHPIDGTRYVLGQLAVTAFQWMTHYANDYFDYDADRVNSTPTRWSGGSRVLVDKLLPRRIALRAAIVLAAIGGVVTCTLAVAGAGSWTILTLVATFLIAWEYSAPPLRLCASGTGELATATVVTGFVPWLGFYLQAPDLVGITTLVLAIVPLALLQIAMLVAIEIPDAAGDRVAGKRTLVVRLGGLRAAQLYAALNLAAFAWLPVAVLLGLPGRVALLAVVPLPFALWRSLWIVVDREPAAYERIAFGAVFTLIATTLGELVAFVS